MWRGLYGSFGDDPRIRACIPFFDPHTKMSDSHEDRPQQGEPKAQYNLALRGTGLDGIAGRYSCALFWALWAKTNGVGEAGAVIEDLKRLMSPEDTLQEEAMFRESLKEHEYYTVSPFKTDKRTTL